MLKTIKSPGEEKHKKLQFRTRKDFSKDDIRTQNVSNSLNLLPLLLCVDSLQNMWFLALKENTANLHAASTVGKGGLTYIWKQ